MAWFRWNDTSHIFEVSTDNGASFPQADVDASAITEGIFAVARIPAGSGHLVGEVKIWPTSTAPSGWQECDGTLLDRTAEANLFAVIGTIYGNTTGSNFRVPDLRGRAPIGEGQGSGLSNRTLAATHGVETHPLVTAELASHTHIQNAHNHDITDPGHTHDVKGEFNVLGTFNVTLEGDGTGRTASAAAISNTTGVTVDSKTPTEQSVGSGTAHENMSPSLVMNYIIKK